MSRITGRPRAERNARSISGAMVPMLTAPGLGAISPCISTTLMRGRRQGSRRNGMRPPIDRTMARWQPLRHTQHMIALHLAGYQPARSVHTRALHALRESVARRAGDALRIDVTDSIVAQGRKASDLLTMVDSGELDGCYFASSYLAGRVPGLGLFDQPFQAGSREDVFGALDGDTGVALANELAAATGYRVLGWWDNGIRHISNAVRPIRTPADCAGLRLRTLDNAQHQDRVPTSGLRSDVHRRRRSAACGGGWHGRCAGEPAHQHR